MIVTNTYPTTSRICTHRHTPSHLALSIKKVLKDCKLISISNSGPDKKRLLQHPYLYLMKSIFPVILLFWLTNLHAQQPEKIAPEGPLLSSVDPYIGTGAHGHTFLGASVPFGAVQVGPTNINKGWDWCSGYHYSDSVVIGFAQNHLSGTGIPDLCDILLMPYTGGDVRLDRFSSYDHGHEIARPDYYSVWLKDQHIKVELTATERVAFHRYSFPRGMAGGFLLDLFRGNFDTGWQHPKVSAYLSELDDSTLIGWRNSSQWAQDRRIYFAIRTNVSLKGFCLFKGDQPVKELTLEADTVKGWYSRGNVPTSILLKIGVSNVSS